MGMMLGLSLAVRFLLELSMLAALGYWGFATGHGVVLKMLLGLGAPALAAWVWGTFLSPKAALPLPLYGSLLLEAAVFAAAAAALHAAGRGRLGLLLFAAAFVDKLLLLALKR